MQMTNDLYYPDIRRVNASEYIALTYVAHVRNGCIFRRRT